MTNKNTIKLVETIASMETTKIIAAELDRVIQEISAIEPDNLCELVACVFLAQLRSGKVTAITVS